MKINNRISLLQQYPFERIEEIKRRLQQQGKEIFDFGMGDPDIELNHKIKNKLIESMEYKNINKYPPYEGIEELKEGIIKYYKETYNIKVSKEEVIILIGSKEGISNIIPAVCDIYDYAIIPEPGYPVYEACCKLWGVIPYKMNLTEQNGFAPRIELLPEDVVKIAKIIIVNYPNNPTGAVITEEVVVRLKDFCMKHNIVLCNDGAYNEIIAPGARGISILEDNKENCIEFGTFSKPYNMTGFRVGYAVGDKNIIRVLAKVKSNLDSGQFIPIQYAALEALKLGRDYINTMREIYDERRNLIESILQEKNIKFFKGKGTFYCWCKVPSGYTTDEFCEELLRKHGVLVTPGYVFGSIGHGYFRISLTKDIDVIKKAFLNIDIYN